MSWQSQISAAENALSQGNLPVGEYLLWEALKLAEQFGGQSPQLIDTAERLGDVLVRQSKFPEAEDLLLRLAEVVGGASGPARSKTGATFLRLAEVYYAQGKHNRAEPFAIRALQEFETAMGKQHPETLRVAGNVAYVFHAQQKYPQAEELYKRAIAEKTKSNKYDAEAMNLMNSYAALLRVTHREQEADHMLRMVQGLQSGNWQVYRGQGEQLT